MFARLLRYRVLLAVVAVAAVGPLACGGGEEPAPTATPSLISSVTPAPTRTVEPAPASTTVETPPTPAEPSPPPSRPTAVLRIAEKTGWPHPDPHISTSADLFRYFGNVYSGLLRWDTDEGTPSGVRRIIPDLAESWEQPDARTYLFRLRSDARWHDVPPVNGRRVTADDVVFSIRRLMAGPHHHSWRYVESARALDAATVEIRLTAPYPPFLSQVADGVNVLVAPEAVEQSSGGDLYDGPVIGTGPFVFDAQASHRMSRGVFHAHPRFHESGTPGVAGIERRVVGSAQLGVTLVRAGRVDLVEVGATDVVRASVGLSSGGIRSTAYPVAGGWALTFKHVAPFDSPPARRAASLALDRQSLWRTYAGTDLPAAIGLGMPVPHEHALLPVADVRYALRYDPDTARRLVAGLGGSASVPFTVTAGGFGPGAEAAAGAAVRQLNDVGFSANLSMVSAGLYAALVQAPPGRFAVAVGPVPFPREADSWLTGRYIESAPFNVIGAPPGDLAALIHRQRVAANVAERAGALRDAQAYLLDHAYQPPLFREQRWLMAGANVRGLPVWLDEPFNRYLRHISLTDAP